MKEQELKVGQTFTNKDDEEIKITSVNETHVDYTINEYEGEGSARKDVFITEVIAK